jgi:hypothetical protein
VIALLSAERLTVFIAPIILPMPPSFSVFHAWTVLKDANILEQIVNAKEGVESISSKYLVTNSGELHRYNILIMKNGVFWDVTPCDSCKNQRFGGTQRLLHQVDNQLLVMANVVPSSPIIITLMMETLSSSETSVLKSHTV